MIMNEIIIKELKPIKHITLTKLNGDVIAEIPLFYLNEETRSIDEVDTISFTIPLKYRNNFSKEMHDYYVYDEVIAERLICVDGEYFVIKEITENQSNHTKSITAYGLENKLEKNTIALSDCGLMLKDKDEETNIYSFDEYLYQQTGWKLGHIDDEVRYMDNGEPKVRMQEETNTSFYSFITETIAEQFCCVPIFDRVNKKINLYDIDGFGNDLKLILHKDNYLKSLEKTYNSSDIVTRLILEGNEEECIVEEANPTGLNYIENYSYFIENEDMSKELIRALKLFEELTPKRMDKWKEYVSLKTQKKSELSKLDSSENILMTKCNQLQNIIDGYNDMETEEEYYLLDDIKSELDISRLELQDVSNQIRILEKETKELEVKINKLNKLCRRETSEDEAGTLLFNEKLLNELKDYIYYDTYSDDSFLDANELIKTGKHILESKCKPTVEFTIDSVNFISRLLGDKTRLIPNVQLGLGDVISTYDKERNKEDLVFFTGWSMNYNDNTLNLTFSNKKTNKENTRVIADLLKKSKETKKIISVNKWLWNKQKYNKVNSSLVTDINLDLDFSPDKAYIDSVSSVDLSQHTIEINLDEEYILKATVLPDTAKNKNMIWISSDENIASVTDGVIVGNGYGACIITVITEDGNKTDTCKVVVEVDMGDSDNVNVTGIRLNTNSLEIDKHESVYLLPTVIPTNANQSITYISSDGNIAKVSNEGLITGVGQGKCTITAISNKNAKIKASCTVTVSGKEAEINIDDLDEVLIIGTKRIQNLQEYNLAPKMTYFGNIVEDFDIATYPSDPKAIVVMLGLNNDSLCDISKIKTLLNSIKTKYTGKYIFVANELPVGINYATTDYTYEQLNSQIKNYNNMLQKITNELGLKSITVQGGMVESEILASHYTYNGLDLNVVGCKMLLNNIKYQIKNNVGSIIVPDDNDNTTTNVNPYREKIMEKAEEIVRMCVNHQANYSQYYRTVDYRKPNTIKAMSEVLGSTRYYQPSWVIPYQTYGWDCSSYVGCCYDYAGIPDLKGLSCGAGTLQQKLKQLGAEYWLYKEEGLRDAKPGDIVLCVNDGVSFSRNNVFTCRTHHVMIYGYSDYEMYEASGYSSGIRKGKRTFDKNQWIFFRLPQVAEADNSNNITSPSDSEHPNVFYENGTIDGVNYVAKLTHSRCTAYGTPSPVGAGGNLIVGKSCGAHNLPYNTKLYIPSTKKYNGDGIWYVKDTGGYTTDFDLLISKSASEAVKMMGSPLDTDVYILEYGDGKMSWSFTEAIEWCNGYYGVGYFHKSWTYYMKYGGCTINIWKFKDHDKYIKSQPWYDKL
jgi:uncharacterized protein YjdB